MNVKEIYQHSRNGQMRLPTAYLLKKYCNTKTFD